MSINMASWFEGIEQGPPIEVFAVNQAYLSDSAAEKVNLSVGAYRTDDAKPWVLPVVKKTELLLANDDTLNHEYLPVLGLESFSSKAVEMVLGADSPAIKEGRSFGVQTLSGTGALRVAAEFLCRILKLKTFYYSKPTWENHHLIFVNAGFTEPREYRYWDAVTRSIDFEGFKEDLRNAPERSVIILHACAHNPTGCDPTQDQWKEIATIVKERNLFPLFDSAYQGFASGDLDKDAWAVQYFTNNGFELLTCQSFAKNFGLYNERAGNLTVVVNNKALIPQAKSQITLLVRGMYSNPPNHGARIVSTVLNDPALYAEWKECIKSMSGRIIEMRKGLRERLVKLGAPNKNEWKHITEQIGMFSYTGLNQKQVANLVSKYHVYLLKSGRINMCGLNTKNVDYVAKAIAETLKEIPDEE